MVDALHVLGIVHEPEFGPGSGRAMKEETFRVRDHRIPCSMNQQDRYIELADPVDGPVPSDVDAGPSPAPESSAVPEDGAEGTKRAKQTLSGDVLQVRKRGIQHDPF